MLYSGTDPESYITEHILVYEENPNAKAGPDAPPDEKTDEKMPDATAEPEKKPE